MPWNERQRQMLGAMGLRVWAPPAGLAGPTTTSEDEAVLLPSDAARATVAVRPGHAAALDTVAPAPRRAAAPQAPTAQAPAPDAVASYAAPVAGDPAHIAREVAPAPSVAAQADPAAAPRPVAAALAAPVAAALSERASLIASLPWPELRQSVAECRACTLCETRKQAVFGVGHEHAHWMIVGEAPGENEDLQGEPFVGRAGQLLDNMLRALQLTRAEAPPAQQVFIANTLKCRPPRNRNPGPEELAQCEPYLQRQIALVQPRVILAMGRFAIRVLLGSDEAIGRLRGRVHTYQGVPVVATYHPAYLLRQPADKAKAWDDLCLAASVHDRAAVSPTSLA